LAIAPTDPALAPNREASDTAPSAATSAETSTKSRRRNTSHLKLVPEPKSLREAMRAKAGEVAARLDKSRPLSKDELEKIARALLEEIGQPEGFLGWTMVALASAFWHDQVAAVPPSRRLFLLPHCLKHAEGCPADYDDFGLECKKCGACSIADFRGNAEALGYKVLVAEGSPIVLKIIVSGYVDAIVGVACLNVLEKAIDKILLAGIPCIAVPLLSSDCRNTSVDEDWVDEMIKTQQAMPAVQTRSYVHLMREAARMFEPAELARLVPRSRSKINLAELNGQGVSGLDPIAGTEAIAYDFLAKGGKHSRPFITLAVYDAMTGGRGTQGDGAEFIAGLPDSIRRAAMSIETFHKASLVHDDIEDDDPFRYGDQTLHQKYGVPTAINVGDYLIGLGYRLVSREAGPLGAEVAAEIVDRLADAHLKLSEGQGAELLWRDACDKRLKALDALKIYALKTAPAFEAAFYTGLRLAGPIDQYIEPIGQFARHLGVAFQILNDLNDWQQDAHNKMSSAGDVVGGRPTLLLALALESLAAADAERLLTLVSEPVRPDTIAEVRRLYEAADVFEKATRLVDKYQQRAESIADEIQPDELRRLLYYLIDTVLERPAVESPAVIMPTLLSVPPVTSALR
jgi:geranylgeranyl pyrophosphate synthase